MSKPPRMQYRFTFTRAEVEHLLACLGERDTGRDAGWYYGNKKQFDERHRNLLFRLRGDGESDGDNDAG